ncbi:hypothetical protein Slin15195_G063250 [Septoria linicola]|uniref:Uncharacterized protein n=1 Tax=Septoria linicola TaxID=215465 RepID=A0A9Q9AYJ8_9PEZI|nr:hypothetical protein Slin14017_G113560 [Septoria linicola]USW53006.1 hypothetical protein Slin15195_G063250 [Septoria linicola]
MASENMTGLRNQSLANAKMLLKPTARAVSTLPSIDTSTTLVEGGGSSAMDIVIFGSDSSYTAAVMQGLKPAIEGDSAPTPEVAMRKLLTATCELLKMYMPKVGDHKRNIHGGGVFDEDLIAAELVRAT